MIAGANFTPYKKWRMAVLAVIGLTLSFIFLQSAKSVAESSSDSAAVTDFLSRIFSEDGLLGAFILGNVRKLAHFFEYGVLGVECAVYVLLLLESRGRGFAASVVFSVMAALLDETIQIFSGRGPMIADVWLDVLGFVTLGGFAAAVWLATECIRGGKIRLKESE